MFNFNLKDLPFAVLNLVSMPICWMQKGFKNLSINHQAKVMWDTLHRAGHEIEDLQCAVARLEKELTARNVFAPIFHRTIEDFAKFKSDRECEKEYPFGYPETPEDMKKRDEHAVNYMMRQHIRDGYFVIPGHTFGSISQGASALKDVLHGPEKDFRTLVTEVEADAVMMHGSMEKYFKATQRAFIREFPDRVAKDCVVQEDRDP